VSLKEELAFVQAYINLQKTRFKEGLQVKINVNEDELHKKIAPVTLQNLVENAMKHNIIDLETPLIVEITSDDGYLLVKNNLQKKNMVETSNKQGLASLQSLYHYLSRRPVLIEETTNEFIIRIPLI
jgi:LytS/YehU family sensor histidine kinase